MENQNKEEKTLGELYPYAYHELYECFFFAIKDFFWFLLIGAILLLINIKIFLFYFFLVSLVFYARNFDIDTERNNINREFILDSQKKIDIILHKLRKFE
ncbi:MAG: hypothetical protein Q7S77_00325 [Candidatus Staskawiczbacteria bacterium]|nr:hypothetical protein [Candidatus Staskawiczbacteria bacterium]